MPRYSSRFLNGRLVRLDVRDGADVVVATAAGGGVETAMAAGTWREGLAGVGEP